MNVLVLITVLLSSTVLAQNEGSIVSWGTLNLYGEQDLPDPNQGFVAIASGPFHGLALRSDSTIVCWGDNTYGCGEVPVPNEKFIAVAAGGNYNNGYRLVLPFSLGLKADSTIVCWGTNYMGQCNVPYPNEDFIAVAAGGWHSLGLKSDGTVICWGDNEYGQCNIPAPNEGFAAVAAGGAHSLGLRADGSIIAWGHNASGQCDVPEPNQNFVSIAAGTSFSLGLKSDGSVVGWGTNLYGVCYTPDPNEGFIAIDVAASALIELGWPIGTALHCLGLREDGSVVAWGFNIWGQCNVPNPNENFVDIAAGAYHSFALQTSVTGIEETQIEADGLEIISVFPNPSAGSVSLRIRITNTPGMTSIKVFDLSGRIVHTGELAVFQDEEITFYWDGIGPGGAALSSGVYLLRVDNGIETATAQVLLVR